MESVDPETGEFYDSSAEDNLHQSRPELRICGHCCLVMQGYASLGDTWLCHPDEGLDCYSAVTLHQHPMRCTVCDPSLRYGSTWDEVKARMIAEDPDRDWTHRCENCGTNLSIPANTTEGRCRAGACVTFLCRDCGVEWASAGPVGCECQGRSKRLVRIRSMYRRRKR